jgi:hypothetical protein
MTSSRTPNQYGPRHSLHGRFHNLRRVSDFLPFGAYLLDSGGRIVQHTPVDHVTGNFKLGDLAGVDFFDELFAGTPLEGWRETFREGVRKGKLYRFVNIDFPGPGGPQEVACFFYYHPNSARAWVFVEPGSRAGAASTTTRIAA